MKVWVVLEENCYNAGDYSDPDVEVIAVHGTEEGAKNNLEPVYEDSGHMPGTRERWYYVTELIP